MGLLQVNAGELLWAVRETEMYSGKDVVCGARSSAERAFA